MCFKMPSLVMLASAGPVSAPPLLPLCEQATARTIKLASGIVFITFIILSILL